MCYEPKKKLLECSCSAMVCRECQIMSAVPKCLSCAKLFTKSFWGSQKQQDLYKLIQRPWEEEVLWNREKLLFENTQQFVEWEEVTLKLKEQLRFGLRPVFPPKPTGFLTTNSMFPCPITECRGYISNKGECGSCKKEVCIKCREPLSDKKHKCDPNVLASLEMIEQQSKPCPKCKVGIEKSHGCAHMFCTFCRTHFDWNTLKIINQNQSTNFHYLNAPSLQRSGREADAECLVEFNFAIPLSVDASPEYAALVHALKDERKRVIFMKRSLYSEDSLNRKHQESLIKLRIQYLKKELEKEEYLRKVWTEEQNYEKLLTLAHGWSLYLENMAYIIVEWRREGYPDSNDVINKFNNLQSCFQECFDAISKDYSCKPPKFVELKIHKTMPLVLL